MNLKLSSLSFLLLMSVWSCHSPLEKPATITVDASTNYQTWKGWEATVEVWHRPSNYDSYGNSYIIPSNYGQEKLDTIVNDLGLTALRLELFIHLSSGRKGMEPDNDNNDPFTLNQSKILWNYLDPYVREFVIPFKERVEANGDKFYLVLSATAWDAWQWNSAEEYAELFMAGMDRLKNLHGIRPDAIIIYNEPDNGSEGYTKVLNALSAIVNRIAQDPFYSSVKLRFPAASTISKAHYWLSFLESYRPASDAMQILKNIGEFDFHGYNGFPTRDLNRFRRRAQKLNTDVVMGEWWFRGNNDKGAIRDNANDIIASLTQADATIYQGTVDDVVSVGRVGFASAPKKGPKYYTFRQFYRYIRPGDLRINVVSDDPSLQVLGFESPQRRHTVVVRNTSSDVREIFIKGLSAGTYGVTMTSPSHDGDEQPTITISSGNTLNFSLPGDSIVTFHERNQGQGKLHFSTAKYIADESINESNAQMKVMVTRRNGVKGAVAIQYATRDGTATAGSDYIATEGTLNFADGETTKTFTIAIVNNDAGTDEGDETINLILSNPGGGASLGTPNQATLWIRDLDAVRTDTKPFPRKIANGTALGIQKRTR